MLKLRISGANLDADVGAAARAALDAAAARLAAEVRQALATPPGGPHDQPWRQTGALQASIGHTVEGDTATVGSTSPYAAAQEHGTRTVPPRPFLLPAAKRLAPDLARDIGRAVQTALIGGQMEARSPEPGEIVLAQSFLNLPRLPPLFANPPKTVIPRALKRLPNQSGKEAAKDVPSWARGQSRYSNENPTQYAERLMNEKWGEGKWEKGPNTEYNKIKKYGERAFEKPSYLLLFEPYDESEI